MKIAKGSKLVMIGDSITDAGRAQPAGEGLFGALGTGYVSLVDSLLGVAYPDRHIRVVNKGTSGNTVRELRSRWRSDVLDLKPDWVSVMIGINDVWRQHDSALQPEIQVTLDEYTKTLDELVAQTCPVVKGFVVMTPYYIEPLKSDAMRAMMDKYGAAARTIAHKYDTLFVDTQAAFNAILEYNYPAAFAWDRVHPGQTGHLVLARAFLEAVDYGWDGK